MVEAFLNALKEAIFAIDRPQIDIANQCGVSRLMLYRITGTSRTCKPYKKNAESLTRYLSAELDDKLRYHIKEVKRLKQIKTALAESYDALYPEKPAGKSEEDYDTQ